MAQELFACTDSGKLWISEEEEDVPELRHWREPFTKPLLHQLMAKRTMTLQQVCDGKLMNSGCSNLHDVAGAGCLVVPWWLEPMLLCLNGCEVACQVSNSTGCAAAICMWLGFASRLCCAVCLLSRR